MEKGIEVLYGGDVGKQAKKIIAYSAVFSPAEEGGYNVTFPDFPGCVTFGRNLREARKKAQEVLELWSEAVKDRQGAI